MKPTKQFLPFSWLIVCLAVNSQIGQVYAHTGGATTETNQSLPLLLFLGIMISLIPFLIGLLIYFPVDNYNLLQNHRPKFLGFATGILLFLFYDYLSLSSFLGLRSPSLIYQFFILITFITTIKVFNKLEVTIKSNAKLAYLWAIGIGIHSLAEGMIMGNNFHLGVTSILLPYPALSFVMHKFAEGVTLAILLLIIHPKNNLKNREPRLEPQFFDQIDRIKILNLVMISVLPTFFGIILGYFDDIINFPQVTNRLQSYLYTISLGIILFIFPNFLPSQVYLEVETKHRYLFWIMIGILFLYLSVYFHEI